MSERRTLWAFRALAVALAILAWAFISLERERLGQRPVSATVQYSLPAGLILLDPIETVNVRLSGPESSISTLNPFEVFVVVDLTEQPAGASEIPLSARDVVRPVAFEVVSIEPNVLTLDLDLLSSEIKPVVVRLAGEPSAGAVAGTPTVTPGSVLVRGPESVLRQVTSVDSRPVDLTGHAITFTEQVLLRSPDPLITVIEPALVTVQVPLEIPNAPVAEGENGLDESETTDAL